MSFVAGAFLLELLPDESAAFACFAAAVHDCLPGYYAPTMTALMVDQEVGGLGPPRAAQFSTGQCSAVQYMTAHHAFCRLAYWGVP
jgi:hypothetical protein